MEERSKFSAGVNWHSSTKVNGLGQLTVAEGAMLVCFSFPLYRLVICLDTVLFMQICKHD